MHVLIIGAGPTGLTLALALRRHGITYRLIDRSMQPSEHSKALAVQARTLDVLDRLGLASAVLDVARPIAGATFHVDGRAVRIDFKGLHPRFPSLVSLPQAETERILLAANPAPERGVELIGLDAGAARLRHADGREEKATADWIVGCDGAHSATRHALAAEFIGAQYPQHLLLVDCRVDGLEAGRVHAFPDADRTIAFFPLPGPLWRAITILPPEADMPEAPTVTPFERPGIRLHDLVWYSSFRISRRMVERFRFNWVLLAGDAAHIHSPVGGQGMNLGMQDAYALASALSHGEAAVTQWAVERHAIARRVLRATDIGTRMMSSRGVPVLAMRRFALSFLARLPALSNRLERALAGLYYPAPE